MAELIYADGTVEEVRPENGREFELEELYRLLDCDLIQVIRTPERGKLAVIDEEGKFREPVLYNRKATARLKKSLLPGDFIAGRCLICGSGEIS